MLRKLLLSGIVFVLLSSCFAVSVKADSSTWSQTYGGTGSDEAYAVVELPEGGYVLAGRTGSFGPGGWDFWLVKTDESGNVAWNRTYGGKGEDMAELMIVTSDGGYAMVGNALLIKTDAEGNMQWNTTCHTSCSSLVELDGAGYALAGLRSVGLGDKGFWLIKTDENGTAQWSKTFEGTEYVGLCSVTHTSDGGYIIAGSVDPSGSVLDGFWLIKTDEYGNDQWNKTYEGQSNRHISACITTTDGGYAIVGIASSVGVEGPWLVKVDASGTVEWEQSYEKPYHFCSFSSLIETSDGGYAIVVNQNCSSGADIDLCLIKTDASGNREWEKMYGGISLDWINSLVETSDGKYALAGYTDSYGAGYFDFWLVKLDECMALYDFETYEFDLSYGYGEYVVVVATNSTVSDFNFGIGKDKISFRVTGPTGTRGAATIIIPEDLLGDCPVYVNDVIMLEGADYTKMYNGTHTIIDLTYSHSTHMIEITGTNVIPEYYSWFIPTLLLVAASVIIIYRKRLSK